MRKMPACLRRAMCRLWWSIRRWKANAARIARWNFDSDEVAEHVRRNRDGGIDCNSNFPGQHHREHSDLRLFVRFTTYDGRRLEANLPIEVQLADDTAAGAGANRRRRCSARQAETVDRLNSDSAANAAGDVSRGSQDTDDRDDAAAKPETTRRPADAASSDGGHRSAGTGRRIWCTLTSLIAVSSQMQPTLQHLPDSARSSRRCGSYSPIRCRTN